MQRHRQRSCPLIGRSVNWCDCQLRCQNVSHCGIQPIREHRCDTGVFFVASRKEHRKTTSPTNLKWTNRTNTQSVHIKIMLPELQTKWHIHRKQRKMYISVTWYQSINHILVALIVGKKRREVSRFLLVERETVCVHVTKFLSSRVKSWGAFTRECASLCCS